MMVVRLIVLLSVVVIAGSDPSALVRRLGAPKYADREAASAAIERLGPDALPALRAARIAPDAEIRSRAFALVDRIENDLMVRPTSVVLDFHDETLVAVLAKLTDRGRANLVLTPRAGELRDRRITLIRPEPASFWEAVDMVAAEGGVELGGGIPAANFDVKSPGSVALILIPSAEGSKPPPVSCSGPFRVSLLNITHNKERNFGGISAIAPAEFGLVPDTVESEQFYAGLQVLVEPRLTVIQRGPPRLTVAEDDLGNSLLPSHAAGAGFVHISAYNQFDTPGGVAIQTTLSLKFPDRAGRTIKTLRGVVPVALTARKGDPLVIPLAEARGKSYHNADATVTVHEVTAGGNLGQTVIELSIRGVPAAELNLNGFAANFPGPRGGFPTQTPFEIVDARGRSLSQWLPSTQLQTPDGWRMTMRVTQTAATGPPTHLRFYEFTRVDTDVDFVFRDVDMP